MTEQESETVNPGQAIYDALSPEAQDAVDALPDDVFVGKAGIEAAKCLAATARMVHELHPDGWLISPDGTTNGREVLSVIITGTRLIQVMYRSVLAIRFDESQANTAIQDWISTSGFKVNALKTWPHIKRVYVPFGRIAEIPKQLWSAHFAAAETMNYPDWIYGKSESTQDWHKDTWRVKLAKIAGEYVPPPAYVPPNRVGLPHVEAAVSVRDDMAPTRQRVGVRDVFRNGGLTYSDAQIASFYTALQTKGFVILSGISGTGKSKIAQRFAEMLPDISVRTSTPKSGNTFRIKYQQYMKDHGQIRLLNEVSSRLPVPDEGEAYNIPLVIDGNEGTCRFWTRPPKHGGTYIHPHGALKTALKNLGVTDYWLHFETDEDESRVDRIELTTSDADLTVQLDHSVEARSNHLFLPVRPDWRDGKALIGYHNPLTGEYVRTGFLDFVLAAADDYRAENRNAFFVILDEMNLAHVEYYFADVLSVIESGRDEEGWTVEGIPLAVGEEDADLPERLHLPPNLYIVGTVNMDETTHPFSPKVLDRAFTIELTEVDFSDYPPGDVAGDSVLEDSERQALLEAFTRNGRYPRIDKDDIRGVVADHPRFRADLASLNTSLKRYRMHFGYRVFDEIMQFVHNAEANGMFSSPDDAFDHAVLMKVLPKFNGSLAKLERALLELIVWSRQSIDATSDDTRAVSDKFAGYVDKGTSFDTLVLDAEDWRYPATGKRAALMMQDLYTDGFAAFG